MYEGHQLDVYANHQLLTGIFNRLGDGKGKPLACEQPEWIKRRVKPVSKEEVSLARDTFKAVIAKQRGV